MSDVTTVYLNPFREGLGFRGSGFRALQEREMPGASAKAWQSVGCYRADDALAIMILMTAVEM